MTVFNINCVRFLVNKLTACNFVLTSISAPSALKHVARKFVNNVANHSCYLCIPLKNSIQFASSFVVSIM